MAEALKDQLCNPTSGYSLVSIVFGSCASPVDIRVGGAVPRSVCMQLLMWCWYSKMQWCCGGVAVVLQAHVQRFYTSQNNPLALRSSYMLKPTWGLVDRSVRKGRRIMLNQITH